LTALREAKKKLAKKPKATLTMQQKDLQGALAVEIQNLKKQLAHFKSHKRQMKNQRAYIRKCEKELEPRGLLASWLIPSCLVPGGSKYECIVCKTSCPNTPFMARRFRFAPSLLFVAPR
jgi:hypothetical protein